MKSSRSVVVLLYLDSFGDLVDVLWLYDGLEVVLQDLGEIVLQLGASEISQDLLPVRGSLQTQHTHKVPKFFKYIINKYRKDDSRYNHPRNHECIIFYTLVSTSV